MNHFDEIWKISDEIHDVKSKMYDEYKATKDDRLYAVSQLLWDAADNLLNIALLLKTIKLD